MYGTLQNVIYELVRKAVLDETIDKHVDKFFEAGRTIEAFDKSLLRNDETLVLIASYVETKAMDKIADQARST